MARLLPIAILCVSSATSLLPAAPKYAGAPPSKKNIPCLVHADRLVETEAQTARQQTKNDVTTYTILGDKSAARTPLASPTLVIESDGMDVEKLRLFRLETKNGQRTITFHSRSKGGALPLATEITQVSGNLYQIDVVDSLPPGEYALSPDGTNDVFCFEVF